MRHEASLPLLSAGANHPSQFYYSGTGHGMGVGEEWVHWAGGHLIVVNSGNISVTALTKYPLYCSILCSLSVL